MAREFPDVTYSVVRHRLTFLTGEQRWETVFERGDIVDSGPVVPTGRSRFVQADRPFTTIDARCDRLQL